MMKNKMREMLNGLERENREIQQRLNSLKNELPAGEKARLEKKAEAYSRSIERIRAKILLCEPERENLGEELRLVGKLIRGVVRRPEKESWEGEHLDWKVRLLERLEEQTGYSVPDSVWKTELLTENRFAAMLLELKSGPAFSGMLG